MTPFRKLRTNKISEEKNNNINGSHHQSLLRKCKDVLFVDAKMCYLLTQRNKSYFLRNNNKKLHGKSVYKKVPFSNTEMVFAKIVVICGKHTLHVLTEHSPLDRTYSFFVVIKVV